MSTVTSSTSKANDFISEADDLTLNANGSGKDVIFQSNSVEIGRVDDDGFRGSDGEPIVKNKNYIINGAFDIWQREITTTSTEYAADDRWYNWSHVGQPITITRKTFDVGQIYVSDNPKYYKEIVIGYDATPATTDYVSTEQRIEYVRSLSGEKASISFWAKSGAASKDIYVELEQNFGTGGSPSAAVSSIGGTGFTITTSWIKYKIENISVPSITGKTLGTDSNDYLRLLIWLSSGSSWDSRNDSLGYQEMTFHIANVQVEKGPIATEFERRTISEELALCQRYYQLSYPHGWYPGEDMTAGSISGRNETSAARTYIFGTGRNFIVEMRETPTILLYSTDTGNSGKAYSNSPSGDVTASVSGASPRSICAFIIVGTSVNADGTLTFQWTAEAEMD